MNAEEIKNKNQIIKQKPNNKRWSDAEISKILEFLQENIDYERPTAQIFYRKLLEATHIDATWNLVRWKVRHLKESYNKAEAWRKSTGAGLLETDEGITSVKDKIKKMCRFYDELHNIFGPKSSEFPFHVFDTGTTSNIAFNSTIISEDTLEGENSFLICEEASMTNNVASEEYDVPDIIEVFDTDCASTTENVLTTTPANQPQSIKMDSKTKAVKEFAAKLKRAAPKNAIDQLSIIQRERNSHFKEKLEFEKEKFKMQFSLKEKRFAEEVEERKNKYELKKIELEKQERIEKFEIEMKYKYCSKNAN